MSIGTKLLFFLMFWVNILFAQKFNGGEINVQQTGTYSVVASVEVFTAFNVELQTIELCWGDGACENIPLIYTEGLNNSSIKFHKFQATHIYGAESYYELSVSDCCWGGNIINMENPQTEDFLLRASFFLSTEDPLFGENTMPQFSRAYLEGNQYYASYYDSEFIDNEGDSVHIEACSLEEILFYYPPTNVLPSAFNVMTIDSLTGSFSWLVPQLAGNYVLGLCVSERRNGMVISEQVRKMLLVIDQPLSTESLLTQKGFAVFPNPANDILNIEIPNMLDAFELSIYTTSGHLVFNDTNIQKVDVSKFDPGIYIIQLQHNGQSSSHRFVIIP